MAAKPRILNSPRDLILSLLPLLVLCAFVAFASQNCSVTGTSKDKYPAYDVSAGLRADSLNLPFPVRLPQTPPGWKPNSGSQAGVNDPETPKALVSNAGYITNHGRYIQLSQSNAHVSPLFDLLLGADAVPAASITIGGHTWQRATTGSENAWVTDLGEVRIALSGKADESDFETLAQAVLAAAPLHILEPRPS